MQPVPSNRDASAKSGRRPAWRRRRRGAVLVEYAFLLVAVGIPTLIGLAYGGTVMFKSYREARNAMLSAFP